MKGLEALELAARCDRPDLGEPLADLRLPERPADDALSEVLRAVRLTRALYYTVEAARPWPAIQVPVGTSLAPALGPRTRDVLSYHIVTDGSCWTGLETGEPAELARGDVILYPRGAAYFLSDGLAPRAAHGDASQLLGLLQGVASGALPPRFSFGPAEAEHTRFVCGFLGCDPRPFDPLLAALPRMLVVRRTDDRLAQLVQLATADVGPGAGPVRERLSESMFIETVRQYLAALAPDQIGWLAGLRDAIVGRALALMHADPGRPWTLVALAKEIAAIAVEVGYDSEAAFSRAFKKASGVAPAAWRDSSERD